MTRRTREGKGGSTAGYDVGYRKPPKANRFQKGQSGNPKGRRSKTTPGLDPASIARASLQESVRVHDGDSTNSVPAYQAAMMQLRAKGLKGDLRALKMWLEWSEKYGALSPNGEGEQKCGVLVVPQPSRSDEEWEAMYKNNVELYQQRLELEERLRRLGVTDPGPEHKHG